MTTTKIDLDELERKARAATPGPWGWSGDGRLYGPPHVVDYGVGPEVDRTQIIETDSDFYPPEPPDREHIAANSPTVTLALVARIRELEFGCEHAALQLRVHNEHSALAGAIEGLARAGVVLP